MSLYLQVCGRNRDRFFRLIKIAFEQIAMFKESDYEANTLAK